MPESIDEKVYQVFRFISRRSYQGQKHTTLIDTVVAKYFNQDQAEFDSFIDKCPIEFNIDDNNKTISIKDAIATYRHGIRCIIEETNAVETDYDEKIEGYSKYNLYLGIAVIIIAAIAATSAFQIIDQFFGGLLAAIVASVSTIQTVLKEKHFDPETKESREKISECHKLSTRASTIYTKLIEKLCKDPDKFIKDYEDLTGDYNKIRNKKSKLCIDGE
ncbi:MAG: hypothetical protein ACFFB5_13015 [Promethearchaeota archaeon]